MKIEPISCADCGVYAAVIQAVGGSVVTRINRTYAQTGMMLYTDDSQDFVCLDVNECLRRTADKVA